MLSHNLLLGAIAGTLIITAPAFAAPIQPFSDQAFHAAQAKGEPILVDAHADWCPTCRAQAPTLDAISKDHSFAHLVILRLDYDHQTLEKRELGIRHQRTLIAFSRARESARPTGITDPNAISAPAATAL